MLIAVLGLPSCGFGPEALHENGLRRYEDGQIDEAIEDFRRSIELDDSRADVFVDLAAAYYERGDVLEASMSCERALQIDPGNLSASALLGRAYLDLGRAREALPLAIRGTQTPVPETSALSTLAAVFLDLGRYEDAERVYMMAIVSLRHFEEAAVDDLRRQELTQEDIGYLCYGVALACRGQRKAREAGLWFDRALVYLPDHSELLYEKGFLLEASGKWREALDCYKLAIRADPFFVDAQVRAGVALYSLGDLLTARDFLLAAREDSSAGPEAAYVLGRIAQDQGFTYEAIDYYREARSMDESMAPAWLREGLLLRSLGFEAEGTECLHSARRAGSSAARWILESESAVRQVANP